jgi:hypothetical protein
VALGMGSDGAGKNSSLDRANSEEAERQNKEESGQ